MILTNINGTSDNQCSCGSWLNHWKKYSGQTITQCPVLNCYDTGLVGAHVQRAYSAGNKWYICPLCATHNKSTDALQVTDSINLVSANKSETCDKLY